MRRQDVEKWVRGQACGLGAWRSETLAALTGGLLDRRRLGVTALAEGLAPSTSLRHRIKRVDRFLGNTRIDLAWMFEQLVGYWCRDRRRVLMALDWTELPGQFMALVLSVIVRGRGVPVAWEVVRKWRYPRSQNAIEEGLLLLVESSWPSGVQRVLVADRGFGRTELARFLQDHGWGYVLRVSPKVRVRDRKGHEGLYADYPVVPKARYRRAVQYRSRERAAQVDLVWTHQARQREPWYLVTNLLAQATPQQVVTCYGHRMRIEEMFRDGKNERRGFGLKETRLRRAYRWDHLLLIWAWAMLLVVLIGNVARHQRRDRGLCSSSRQRLGRHNVLSDVTIALRVIWQLNVTMSKLLKTLPQIQNGG